MLLCGAVNQGVAMRRRELDAPMRHSEVRMVLLLPEWKFSVFRTLVHLRFRDSSGSLRGLYITIEDAESVIFRHEL